MNTEKSPGQLAYEFHVSKRICATTLFMDWDELPQEGKEAWESTAAFMSGGDAEPKENLVEPSEENISYWTQRIMDKVERPLWNEADIEKVIRELLTADTHYATTQPQAAEGQREALKIQWPDFETWSRHTNARRAYDEMIAAAQAAIAPTGEVPSVVNLSHIYWNTGAHGIGSPETRHKEGIAAVREAILMALKAGGENVASALRRAPYSPECQAAIAEIERRFENENVELVSMEHHVERIDTLTAENAKLVEERDELAQWKESAMSVFPPVQEIAKELGDIPFGASIHDKILPGIQKLKSERDRANAEVEEMTRQRDNMKHEVSGFAKQFDEAIARVERAEAKLASLQWVSINYGLPTPYDLDEHGEVMWAHNTFSWRGKLAGRNAATHWRRIDLPTPEPSPVEHAKVRTRMTVFKIPVCEHGKAPTGCFVQMGGGQHFKSELPCCHQQFNGHDSDEALRGYLRWHQMRYPLMDHQGNSFPDNPTPPRVETCPTCGFRKDDARWLGGDKGYCKDPWHQSEQAKPNIIITHHRPPIPVRSFDWSAYRDGYDEGEPIGWGATKDDAINDLLGQEGEE